MQRKVDTKKITIRYSNILFGLKKSYIVSSFNQQIILLEYFLTIKQPEKKLKV